tara:strand:- start:1346 stop:2431 length:1086 start_codon:yes stop_codon:yes gene_type:complete
MIKLIKPYIYLSDIQGDLEEIFSSGQFTQGININKFEKELKSYTSADFVGLTTSATTALSLSLRVLGVKQGSKVAVSDYSWPASSNVIEELDAKPIFVDINPSTFNMCANDLNKKLDSSFDAVIFVDTFGNPSGIDEIKNICDKYSVPLLEDAACAIGSKINEIKIGNFSDITCFSFHPRKLLNTGEGGAILTNNQEYANKFKVKLAAGASSKAEIGLNFTDFGFNFRMTEIQALMGWKQLKRLDSVIEERKKIKEDYIYNLSKYNFTPQYVNSNVIHNVQSVVFRSPDNLNRNDLIKYLYSNGIETTLGTYCLSGTNFNNSKYNDIQPNSYKLESDAITFPCYTGIDLQFVMDKIKSFIE